VIIVTDGAVDLPDWLEESPAIRKVTGRLWLGDEPVRGGTEEFWSLVRDHKYPSTTPPTVSDLTEAYRHQDLAIGLHISSTLSATIVHANEAASRAGPGAIVIDSRSFGVGTGLIVAAVLRAVENPQEHESIIDYARSLPERLHTFALIQEIETLRRSDRSGLLPPGHMAKNHPLLLSVRGRVMTLGQFKNRDAALRKLVWHVKASAEPVSVGAWAMGHGDVADAAALLDQLSRQIGSPPAFVTRLDPTVGAHLGPDSVVVGALSGPVEL
jgi:fatty acid kinase fatty acid binding subunit